MKPRLTMRRELRQPKNEQPHEFLVCPSLAAVVAAARSDFGLAQRENGPAESFSLFLCRPGKKYHWNFPKQRRTDSTSNALARVNPFVDCLGAPATGRRPGESARERARY